MSDTIHPMTSINKGGETFHFSLWGMYISQNAHISKDGANIQFTIFNIRMFSIKTLEN